MESTPIRVLIAKPGLDGHDRGAKVVARALRDAGMEVVYTGIRQTPQMIADTAMQEDVHVIGLSSLSGAHMSLFKRVLDELHRRKLDDLIVIAGGIIPDEDHEDLRRIGVSAVFGPGSSTQQMAEFIRSALGRSS